MKKVILQGLLSLLSFGAVWFLLAQIGWMNILKVDRVVDKTEKKIGDMIWNAIENSDQTVYDKKVTLCVDSIFNHLCEANNIDPKAIHLHIMMDDEVNAFALPDGHLIINTGLLKASGDEAALAGVIGHELAHIQKGHVMKKITKEVGISAIISVTSGGAGSEVVSTLIKSLSSSAYDRTLEKEADIQSVEYLLKAKIDPSSFADFLYDLGTDDNAAPDALSWINSHPDSKERGEYVVEYCKGKVVKKRRVVQVNTWKMMLNNLGSEYKEH